MGKNCRIKIVKILLIPLLAISFFVVYGNRTVKALNAHTINFQGKIVRNDTGYEGLNVTAGSPACVVSGSADSCDFKVSYYNGTDDLFIQETFTDVEIGNFGGVFNLSLGSGTISGTTNNCGGQCDSVLEVITQESNLYIQLEFAPDGTNFTETFARMPLEASAYSLFSETSRYSQGANDAFKFSTTISSATSGSPVNGMVYYDTSTDTLKLYNGTSWVDIADSSNTVSSLWAEHTINPVFNNAEEYMTSGGIGSLLSGFSLDSTSRRASINGNSAKSGLSVYSSYTSTNPWTLVSFKADSSNFTGSILDITQDGTGKLMRGYKGAYVEFEFDNIGDLHLNSDGAIYFEGYASAPATMSGNTGEGCMYSYGGDLYWNPDCDPNGGIGTPELLNGISGSTSLWTDAGTFTYLTASTDDLVFGGTDIATATFVFDIDASGGSYFEVDSADNLSRLFTIADDGNVGIGVLDPTAKLEIGGAQSIISNTSGDITIDPDGDLIILDDLVGIGTTDPEGNLHLSSTGNAWLVVEADANNTSPDDQTAGIKLRTDGGVDYWDIHMPNRSTYNANLVFANPVSSYAMVLDGKNGNLGLGVATPASRLHLRWADSGAGGGMDVGGQLMNDAAVFENSGNVFLQLMGGAANERSIVFSKPTNAGDGAIKYNYTGTTGGVANGFGFWTNGNVFRMAIDSEGRVGIGTSSPTADLEVGLVSKSSNTVVRALAGDLYTAGFEAFGNTQGTGYVFVGQSASFGGGIFYNGDGNPGFASGEVADHVSFYRKNGSNEVVFSYPYSGNTVTFNGDVITSNLYASYLRLKNSTSYYLYEDTGNNGWRANGNFLVNQNIYLGTRGIWLSGWLDQSVLTTSSPTFSDVRANYHTLSTLYGTNQFQPGTGDGATTGTYNVALKGWYGMAFTTYDNSVHGVLNFRTGTFNMDGGYLTYSPYLSYNYIDSSKTKADYQFGDVVKLESSQRWVVNQTNRNADGQLYGVVVRPEGFVSIPKELKSKLKQGGTIDDYNVVPVAHLGEASTKVVIKPGQVITTGTYLTSSEVEGFAELATSSGNILGKALEGTSSWNTSQCPAVSSISNISWPQDDGSNPSKPCFTLPNGDIVGKVMIFVNVGWFDANTKTISEQVQTLTDSFKTIEEAFLNLDTSSQIVSSFVNQEGWYRVAESQLEGSSANIKIKASTLIENQSIELNVLRNSDSGSASVVNNYYRDDIMIPSLRFVNNGDDVYLEAYVSGNEARDLTVSIYDNQGWKINNWLPSTYEGESEVFAVEGVSFSVDNAISISNNLMKVTGNIISTNTSDLGAGTNRWNDVYASGSIRLGNSGSEGSIRYNIEKHQLEFSNDGQSWIALGDLKSQNVLSPEYAGAVLYADGSDNYGTMTSDVDNIQNKYLNYYQWTSEKDTLQDYDILVRVTLPDDFIGWNEEGITLDYVTENSASIGNNKVDMYLYSNSSNINADGQSVDNISKLAGQWQRTSIKGVEIDQCNKAGDTCVLRIVMSAKDNYYTRVGDIILNYNRSL